MTFPLESSTPTAVGLAPEPLARLEEIVTRHIAEGRYPGAQVAVARNGKLALFRSYGDASIDPTRVPAAANTL